MSTAVNGGSRLYQLGQRMPDLADTATCLLLQHSGIHPLDVPGETALITRAELEAEIARRGLTITVPDPLPTPTEPEARAIVQRMQSAGAHLVTLVPGGKNPTSAGWPEAAALTEAEAVEHLAQGGNVGVGLAPSRLVVLDAEDARATQAVIEAGFTPTVITAKAVVPGHAKWGGSHTWLRVPDGIDAWPLPTNGSRRISVILPNGGKIDVLAGRRQAVAPPSLLAETGTRYAPAAGGALDPDSGVSDIPVAPMWLFDSSVPAASLSTIGGALIPDETTTYERVEADARSRELTDRIDEISWDVWLAGETRLTPTGQLDSCGCEIYHWNAAENGKSATLHDGCSYGYGAHIWSGTMMGDLRLDNDHLSRLNLAAKLRGVKPREAAATVGIQLGGGQEELAPVRPEHYEQCAREAAQRGDDRAATMYRKAAAVLRALMPADIDAGEIGSHSRIAGGVPTPPQRPSFTVVEGGGEGSDAPRPAVTAVPPIFSVLPSDPVGDTDDPPPLLAGDPGPFPVDALPAVLREHCEWVMEAVNVPASMIGPMYLPLLSAACGRAVIAPRPGWREHGPIWATVVAPPSSRKSPVLNAVKAPLVSAQRLLRDRTEQIRLAAEAMADAAGESLEDARTAYQQACKEFAATVDPGMMLVAEPDQLRQLRERMEQLRLVAAEAAAKIPPNAKLSFDDATDAALQEHLRATGGCAFMLAPEGSRWFYDLLDPRNAAITSSTYLDPYDGGDLNLMRIGRGEVTVENCYLSMLVIIQPEPLFAALKPDRDGRRRLIGDGTWSRIGASIVGEVEPDDFDRCIPDGTGAINRYEAIVEREFLRSYGREDPLRFELDVEARAVFGAIYDRIERVKVQANARSSGDGMAEAWGKAAGRTLRIARVFTQISLTDAELAAPGAKLIGADAIRTAWLLAEWLLASAAHGLGGTAPATDQQLHARCLTWLRRRLAKAAGAVEYRALHNNARHRPYLQAALDELAGAGEAVLSPGPISNATVTATEALQRSA